MSWLGRYIGQIILPGQKRSNPVHQLYANPTQEDKDALSGCYYWVNNEGKQPVRKREPVGLIRIKGQCDDENTLLKQENIDQINEMTESRANFVRTDDELYYVYSRAKRLRCVRLNLSPESLRNFDLEMGSYGLRLLSAQEVLTIKEKFCSELDLELGYHDVKIDLEEIKQFKNIDDVSTVTQIDFDLIYLQQKGYTVSRYPVPTHGGAQLDTIRIELETARAGTEKKYIINFCGNMGSSFDDLDARKAEADAGYTTIGFNYCGVLGSGAAGYQPESKQNLIDDGIAQVQALLKGGVDPHHINLSGTSIGGAIVLEVSAHFHRQKIPIRVFSDRTFSSLQTLVKAYTADIASAFLNPFSRSFYKTTYLGIVAKIMFWPLSLIVVGIGYLIASAALQISNWDLRPAEAVKNIPEQNREYFVAKTPKSIFPTPDEYVDDEIIPYPASLYKHPFLQQERRKHKQEDNPLKSTAPLGSKYRKFYIEGTQGTHNTRLSELQNSGGDTAFDVRMRFFNRSIEVDDEHDKLHHSPQELS